MYKPASTLALLLAAMAPCLQAATNITSCSATGKTGYAITKIQERASACSGKNLYTFTLLAGEKQLEICNNAIPAGWVNSKLRSYSGSGACGAANGIPKQVWQISNTYGQTKLTSCSRTLPTGWVITKESSYSGLGDCGKASSGKLSKLEVQSTAGQTQLNVCRSSTLPSGWAVAATSSSSVCGSGSGNLWKILNNAPPAKIALHHYANTKNGDHMYVIKRDDPAMAKQGYSYQSVLATVPNKAVFGTTPLHRYYNKSSLDSLYTTTRDDALLSKSGYAYVAVATQVYTAAVPKSVPLYRYWNATNKHHLYLTALYSNGVYGFKFEKIEGYVYQP
ncbi:hypothetical protein [Pseudomonas sp. Gutcm_11s]|uniref:hypothetical protein n=1 Tax=Pseudomonas sp. Gutcm_11s TaxID=3026088 RepID=UPI00236057ED|nr:hypothetical protein [Pseudomonas sp. Gutcm_11s]MDD0842116.1 hypothetical protein [Pseudomonas sp. Gutcm_11s]